tara:strand:- start:1593 stop:3548 length:1956 start_codon:yes stop_codon:yes gene_type:complete
MLMREEEEFNLGDYAQKVGDALGKTAYTVGRGIPQIGTGMIDLLGLPFTMSGIVKPENVVGSTDYATKLGLLPEQSKGIFGESSAGDFSDALLSSVTPTAAAKTAILSVAPFFPQIKDYVQQIASQGKNIFQQGADLSKDINEPMLSKMYGKGGGGGLLSNFDDIDELGYYSPTLRSVENINQPSGTGEQFLSMLKKDANVKQEELEWIGLPDFLTRKKQFTKEEVMDFVKDNTINLKREQLVEGVEVPHETGYPDLTFNQKDVETAPGFKVYGYRMDPSDNYPTGDKQAEVIAQTQMEGHFDVPPDFMGVDVDDESGTYGLAHLRFTDRVVDEFPNEKALFVEEIQSDFHKSARGQKGAYQSQKATLTSKESAIDEALYEFDMLQDEIKAQQKENMARPPFSKEKYDADTISLQENFVEQNKDIVVSTLKEAINSQTFDATDTDKEVIKKMVNKLSKKDITPKEILDLGNLKNNSQAENDVLAGFMQPLMPYEDSFTKMQERNPMYFIETLLKKSSQMLGKKLGNLKPDAPFKKEHELGVKETIKLAVEEGYDRAVFSTPESVASHSSSAPTNVYKQANEFVKKYAKKIGAKVETVTMKNEKDGEEYKFLSIPITPELKELIQKIGQPIVQQQNNMGIFAMNEPMSMGIM